MLSKSDYLVPKSDATVDLDIINQDTRELNLEKSWKSLNTFQQTHKGRLDSAKSGPVNEFGM